MREHQILFNSLPTWSLGMTLHSTTSQNCWLAFLAISPALLTQLASVLAPVCPARQSRFPVRSPQDGGGRYPASDTFCCSERSKILTNCWTVKFVKGGGDAERSRVEAECLPLETRKLFRHVSFCWGSGFGVCLSACCLSEHGHRQQDQFLEEKLKGSWKVGHCYSAVFYPPPPPKKSVTD